MRTEIVERLATALRSGNYRQIRGQLVKRTPQGVGHCVLGVLAELAVEDGILDRQGSALAPLGYTRAGMGERSTSSFFIPTALREWAGDFFFPVTEGMKKAFPDLSLLRSERVSLVFFNDNKKVNWTFDKIADYLDYARENGAL